MENILDSYKKIVHKAVDLGLLSEENKLFYLSSIDQSAPIRSNLDGNDLQSPHQPLRNSCKQSINGFREPDFCCAHAMSTAIEDTLSYETSLENYSDYLEMKSLTASDSDLDYYHHHYHQPCGCCRSRAFPTKLIRNEIVDFRIPIYVGIGKKKSKKKPKKSFRADFKGFSSEDVSHDERNTFSKRHFRNQKSESKKEKVERFRAVETPTPPRNALENDLVVCDILYDDQNDECNFTSAVSSNESRQVGSATEKARGDGLKENQPTLSKELNQQLDIRPSANSKCNDNVPSEEVSNSVPDTVLVNDRFEMSVSGDGSDYCKMKEVLVVNSAEDAMASQPKEKLLQVNIFCQLVPNAASNVTDQKEDVPNIDCDSKSDQSPTPEASKKEKNKGTTKEKIRRKRTLPMLSKMFSRIKLSSRFNK